VDLTLSTNDLQVLPESLGNLEKLVTLKLEDNKLESLPSTLGKMADLEEVFAAENFLECLPPSVGWLRKLHTLNIDENDLEDLPPEIGSCRNMKVLSVHGNKLTSLPAELGHISRLAVLNVSSNHIPHLPVSFIKLKNITAMWLADNQTKPLVQLNQDVDPYTGQRVLTNFLLPQQPEEGADGGGDNNSESGSFHASVWEEERSKKSLVKWAGEEQLDADMDKTGNLRRAPTPFPKEMRAMAKKVQSMRDKKKATEEASNVVLRKKTREYRPKGSRRGDKKRVDSNGASPTGDGSTVSDLNTSSDLIPGTRRIPENKINNQDIETNTVKEQLELRQFDVEGTQAGRDLANCETAPPSGREMASWSHQTKFNLR